MKIALVSEGTYPYAVGGVSTWCDQLIRGFPEYRWDMVALTVDGTERPLWSTPANLDALHRIPVWGSRRPGRAPAGAQAERFAAAYETLLAAMLTPPEIRSSATAVWQSRFLLGLRAVYDFATAGGDPYAAVTTNQSISQLLDAARKLRGWELELAEAAYAADVLGHLLRPLAAAPPRCDLVHASMNGLSMLVAMAAKWRDGTPVVMSEHGIYLRERYLEYMDCDAPPAVRTLLLGFFRSLAAAGYLISDVLAPHSDYNRRWQHQFGADPDRIWTMYNGVELDQFPVAEGEPAEPTVVYLGRINPLKDVHTLIRAFATVRTRVRGARLRIFGAAGPGDEAYAASCRQLAEDLGLARWVTFEGSVDSPVTAYHAGTVVTLTSISEGFPVAVVEAMACGRAMVCTNVGGVSEAVADAGFVVAPRDPLAVADALTKLLTDHGLRRRMARTARERVTQWFTLADSLHAYRQVYEALVAQPHPAVAAQQRQLPVATVRPATRLRVIGRVPLAHIEEVA
ncbi:glycosyltransferase involved in cell wall biosynthesis [Hamadaea flava]|uniref:GT4 family glycosyltransferase PelF n=1 Tax=Hamadaea flava TaxID=1742688 RepID=A0ABV8LPI6_9ACTN|nr:GT4 family glycosyltransferase PelF [Hamadaea flava]MCP2323157.1 glycosyltransferase involved in cell wall biosynthesis [Hamadaea flava]